MASIRPLRGNDLPAVAALVGDNLPDWSRGEDFLKRTLIDSPWADDELPSLVAEHEGRVVGFVGSQPRRVRLDDRILRGVCVSHLVVAPGQRAGATGALLLGRLLKAGQDLTWSDSANEAVVRIWRTFGGQVDHARICDWMLVLRPGAWFAGVTGEAIRKRAVGRRRVPVGAIPVHALPRIRKQVRALGNSELESEEAGPEAIVAEQAAATRGLRLLVDHDAEYLAHTFAVIEADTAPVSCRIVRRGTVAVGWYAYTTLPGRVRRVLHVAAAKRQGSEVLDQVVTDARADRVTVLTGRLEPILEDALHGRLAILGLARKPVVHTRNPEVQALASTSAALLTQLDGEWFVT